MPNNMAQNPSKENEKMITTPLLIILVLIFSFSFWQSLFTTLDYFKISYTKKTKNKMFFVIFGNLFTLILLLSIVQRIVDLRLD